MMIDTAIQTIPCHTNDGSVGYQIKKFEIMPNRESDDIGAVVKIFSVPQTAVDTFIDFSDQTLLAAALYRQDSANQYNFAQKTIFDNMVFNQDIHIVYNDAETAGKFINYYIELEVMKLDLNARTLATLKDIRNISSQ